MSMHYHPCKANVVADALSRLSMGTVAHVEEEHASYLRVVLQTLKDRQLFAKFS